MQVRGNALAASVAVSLSVLASAERAACADDASVEAFFRGKTRRSKAWPLR